jgi:hypothetical protein
VAQIVFSTAPGSTVNVTAATGGINQQSPTAAAFVVGIADRGPTTPIQVLDFIDFQTKFGSRNATAAVLSDSVEAMFAEGTTIMYVARVIGPGATYGSVQAVDRAGSPSPTMLLTAKWAGVQSSNISYSIAAGTVANSFDVLVYDTAAYNPSLPVETYRDNLSVANAVAAINAVSSYLVGTDSVSPNTGTTAYPAIVTNIPLSSGNDDRTNAVDANWATALNSFPATLGAGLLLAPGRYTSSAHLGQMAAAVSQSRFAYLDTAPLPAAADITALALGDSGGTGYTDPGDSGLVIGPWVTIPPAPGGSVPRQVPQSATLAGRTAAVDALFGHSNQAPMGFYGSYIFANGLVGPGFIESDRITINGRQGTTGGCIARSTPQARCQVFGFRTVSTAMRSYFAANIRETLRLKRALSDIGDSFVGREIDGQGSVFTDFANAIGLVLLQSYQGGALYGATPALAFGVDVGQTVNTPATVQAGIIKARVWFVPSPTGERVQIELVRNPIPS